MASDHSFADVENQIREFSRERNWDKFHQPKNLILAAMGELGELAEILQWKNDSEVIDYLSTGEGQERIKEEIADVAIYLIRLCQTQNIDFLEALNDKLLKNEKNYPVEKSKDNSSKYTEFK
jgi:dCTP diphosphatase